MPLSIDTAGLDAATAQVDRLAGSAPALLRALLGTLAPQIRDIAQPILVEATPIAPEGDPHRGTLRDSVESAILPDGDGLAIEFREPAESAPSKSGKGGGYHYVKPFLEGWQQALLVPNPFAQTAADSMRTPIDALLSEQTGGVIRALLIAS